MPDPPLTKSAVWRGNATLWAFLAAICIFKVWQRASDLPPTVELYLIGGLFTPSVGLLTAFVNFLLGWLGLAALLSSANLRGVLTHLHRPLVLIDDPKMQRFFAAPATFALALLVLGGSLLIAFSVWVVDVRSDYELIAELKSDRASGFVEDGGVVRRHVLAADAPARVVLGGIGSNAVLLFRDKYGFRTLEALSLRRRWLSFGIAPCVRTQSVSDALLGVAVGARDLEVDGRLRWSSDTVRLPLILKDGKRSGEGWILAGDGRDGPEQGAPPYAQRFLDWLFQSRDSVARWYTQPAYSDSIGRHVHRDFARYSLDFDFDTASLGCRGQPVDVRDAKMVTATERSE